MASLKDLRNRISSVKATQKIYRDAQHPSHVLLPVIEDICRRAGVELEEVDLFACTVGPGSFTGLRIGLSTVKGFALATGKPAAECRPWKPSPSTCSIPSTFPASSRCCTGPTITGPTPS